MEALDWHMAQAQEITEEALLLLMDGKSQVSEGFCKTAWLSTR